MAKEIVKFKSEERKDLQSVSELTMVILTFDYLRSVFSWIGE